MDGDDFTFLAYRQNILSLSGYFEAIVQMHENLNGRVIGNMLQLVMVGLPILSALVRATIMFALVYLAVGIVSPKTRYLRNLTIFIMLAVPAHIFSQTYAWHAGFFNYVTSALGFLAILHVLQLIFIKNEQRYQSSKYGVLLLLLAILTSLFAENVTTVLLILSIATMAYALLIRQPIKLKLSAWLLAGSLIGLVCMFSSPAYSVIADGTDEYRSIATQDAISPLETYTDKLYRMSFGLVGPEGLPLVILGLVLIIVQIIGRYTKKDKSRLGVWAILAFATALFYPIFIVLQASGEFIYQSPEILHIPIKLITVAMSLVFIFVAVVGGAMLLKRPLERVQVIMPTVLSGMLLAPFVFINPFGGRNFLLSYILLSLSLLLLLNARLKLKSAAMDKASSVVLSVLGLMLLAMFSVVKFSEHKNNLMISDAKKVGQSSIELRRYPFNRWVRNNNDPVKVSDYVNGCDCPYGIQCSKDCTGHIRIRYAD